MFSGLGRALSCLPGGMRRWRATTVAAVVLAGLAVPAVAIGTAAAATVPTGTLALAPGQATAGGTADAFVFAYVNTDKAGPGTIIINVPAGFSVPQDTNPHGAGYLGAGSLCAQFHITGIAAGPAGSSVISIAEKCAPRLGGVLLYSRATVPATAGSYSFAASFTPANSSAATPFGPLSVTVRPGPLAGLTLSPAGATITPGSTQSYTVSGADAYGNTLGAVTNASFAIAPDGSCTGATCTATTPGTHTVTATSAKISGTTTLTVSAPPQPQADLAVTETVSSTTPYYYSPVTFTTTVTNTSTTTQSDGVTVTAALPAGLVSPAETASAGSYDATAGTWTVGSLAPGASATLTFSGDAGDVSLGTQTATAMVSATTTDPNSANNTALASEASQPAHIGATIVPSSNNPSNVDVSLPGYEAWTTGAYNAEIPSAPAPVDPGGSTPGADYTSTWFCHTASLNPCPAAAGTDDFNQTALEYLISSLTPDTYTITLQVCASISNTNYVAGCPTTSVSFTVSNSGAG